jgi:hypothetical protein
MTDRQKRFMTTENKVIYVGITIVPDPVPLGGTEITP